MSGKIAATAAVDAQPMKPRKATLRSTTASRCAAPRLCPGRLPLLLPSPTSWNLGKFPTSSTSRQLPCLPGYPWIAISIWPCTTARWAWTSSPAAGTSPCGSRRPRSMLWRQASASGLESATRSWIAATWKLGCSPRARGSRTVVDASQDPHRWGAISRITAIVLEAIRPRVPRCPRALGEQPQFPVARQSRTGGRFQGRR